MQDAYDKLMQILSGEEEYYNGSFHEGSDLTELVQIVYKTLFDQNNNSIQLIIDKNPNICDRNNIDMGHILYPIYPYNKEDFEQNPDLYSQTNETYRIIILKELLTFIKKTKRFIKNELNLELHININIL